MWYDVTMNNKEIKELTKALNKVAGYRVDPLTKLFLCVVIGVPILAIILIILGVKLYKNYKSKKKPVTHSKKLRVVEEKPPVKFKKPSELYYEVVRLKAEEQSLTQYVKLYTVEDNDFRDVTESLANEYKNLMRYSGRSKNLKGTVVLTDFDIIQFQRELGSTKLIRTISE